MLLLIILVHFNDYKTTLTSPRLTVSKAAWRKPGCRCYGGKEKKSKKVLAGVEWGGCMGCRGEEGDEG